MLPAPGSPMIAGVYMMIQKALEVSKSNFSSLQIQFIGFRFPMKMLAYSFMVWFFVLLCLLWDGYLYWLPIEFKPGHNLNGIVGFFLTQEFNRAKPWYHLESMPRATIKRHPQSLSSSRVPRSLMQWRFWTDVLVSKFLVDCFGHFPSWFAHRGSSEGFINEIRIWASECHLNWMQDFRSQDWVHRSHHLWLVVASIPQNSECSWNNPLVVLIAPVWPWTFHLSFVFSIIWF